MDRELALLVLALSLCGPLTIITGAVRPKPAPFGAGWQLERFWWRRVWLPVLPSALVIATLVGWALQEPHETDEIVTRLAVVLALLVALIWLRAAIRALRAAAGTPARTIAVGTIGIFRPRVFISPELAQVAEPEVLAAAREHEAAHARHGDPRRIWLAQLATDLQWPSSAARARWRAWREALELARDDEARVRGADGVCLAEAIVTAIQLGRCESRTAVATLIDDPQALRTRISRLLAPVPPNATPPPQHRLRSVIASVALMGTGAFVGLHWGEAFIRVLPIVIR